MKIHIKHKLPALGIFLCKCRPTISTKCPCPMWLPASRLMLPQPCHKIPHQHCRDSVDIEATLRVHSSSGFDKLSIASTSTFLFFVFPGRCARACFQVHRRPDQQSFGHGFGSFLGQENTRARTPVQHLQTVIFHHADAIRVYILPEFRPQIRGHVSDRAQNPQGFRCRKRPPMSQKRRPKHGQRSFPVFDGSRRK